ncbi:MAG: hypothetical protein IKQ50_00120 [Paludibacteraceae bacterium]|nr:hypothetical protein [Paludibacteraceae bacterium]
MEELIKYFESLEARIAALEEAQQTNEAVIASLEAEVEELKNRPAAEPQVVEKIVEKPVEVIKEVVVEKPVEVVKEVIVEKPVVVAAPVIEPEPVKEEPVTEEPSAVSIQPSEEPKAEEPKEETAAPKAMLYGKPVDDIRQAISLGDRFLYQRELFGQNAELMQRTLTELNGLSSFDEALQYIGRFGWDTESNSYQQFLVTLHRRFG